MSDDFFDSDFDEDHEDPIEEEPSEDELSQEPPGEEFSDESEDRDPSDEKTEFMTEPIEESPRVKSSFFGEPDEEDEVDESPARDYFSNAFETEKPLFFEEENTPQTSTPVFEEEDEFAPEEHADKPEEEPEEEPVIESKVTFEDEPEEPEEEPVIESKVTFEDEPEEPEEEPIIESKVTFEDEPEEPEEEPVEESAKSEPSLPARETEEPPAFAPYSRGDWSAISDADGTAEGDNYSSYRVEEHTVTERTVVTRTVTTTRSGAPEPIPLQTEITEPKEPVPEQPFAQETAQSETLQQTTEPAPEPVAQEEHLPPQQEIQEQPEVQAEPIAFAPADAAVQGAAAESDTEAEDAAPEDGDEDRASDKTDHSVSSDLIRGHINTIILRSLYDGDKYGYEIIAEIERKSHNQYTLKQPSLYSALKRLEKDGYITSYWGGSVSGGRRKYFSLTDAGKEISERNQNEWEYSRTVIDSLISDKDFDFASPAPTAVDMRVLRKSTSRVPHGENDEFDFEDGGYEEPYDDSETVTTETVTTETTTVSAERTALEEERSRMEENLRQREEMLRIREEAGSRREQELLEREFAMQAEQERREQEAQAREQEALDAHNSEIEEREQEIERLRAEAEEREQEIERLRAEAEEREELDQTDEIEEREQEIARLRAEAEDREQEIERLRAEAEERENGENEEREQELERLRAEAEEREQELERLRSEAEERDREAERTEEETRAQIAEEQEKLLAEAQETARREERERVLAEIEEQRRQEQLAEEERQRQEEEQQRIIAEAQETARQEERERVYQELEDQRREAEKERERTEAAEEIQRLHMEAEARERKIIEQSDEIERAKAIALNAEKNAQNERIIRMEPFAEERARYEDRLREQSEHFEKLYNRGIADTEMRVRAEEEERFRQREHQIIHQNYINLLRGVHSEQPTENPGSYYYTPPESESYAYDAKSEKEKGYRSAIKNLINPAMREEGAPEQPYVDDYKAPPPPPPPSEPLQMEPEQRTEPEPYKKPVRTHGGGMDFYDLEMRAEQDGIKVSISNKREQLPEEKKDMRLVNKGKALFLSALVVFVICLIEGSLWLGLKNVFHIPIAYPIIVWGTGAILLLVTGLMYVNHYGERALRQTGNIIVNVLVAFALLVIVTLIVALARQIDFTDASQVMCNVVIPILYFLNIVIFGVCYFLLIRPRKDE